MISGEKSCLRRIERDDFAKIWAWWNSDIIQDWTHFYPFPKNFESVPLWYSKISNSTSKEAFIIHTFDQKTAGIIELTHIDWRCGCASIRMLIGEEEYSNEIYGRDAMKTLLNFAFTELNLKRIEGKAAGFSKMIIRTFKECGFIEEGKRRKKILWNGTYYDEYLTGILKEEFLQFLQK